jgi:type II restriction enzyme
LGAAWGPQKDRMDAAIYFPLYLVLAKSDLKEWSIFYLSADLQIPALFEKRKPLSATARRAYWQGFKYDLKIVHDRFVRLA